MTAIEDLSLAELRVEWSKYWDMPAHKGMGRAMLEASLKFKQWERDTGGIPKSVQRKLDELLSEYRSNRNGFNPKLVRCPENADRNFGSVGNKYFRYFQDGLPTRQNKISAALRN